MSLNQLLHDIVNGLPIHEKTKEDLHDQVDTEVTKPETTDEDKDETDGPKD
jgi:hypothetical protein